MESEVHYARPGMAEQDPADLQVRNHDHSNGDQQSGIESTRVAALSIDSQAGGIMGIDRQWQPVTHLTPPSTPAATRKNAACWPRPVTASLRLQEAPQPTVRKYCGGKREHPEAWKRIDSSSSRSLRGGVNGRSRWRPGFYRTRVHGLVRPERFREPAVVGRTL